MSSFYSVRVPSSDPPGEEEFFLETYELDIALALFFGALKDGAETAELRWSA